ncbi:MAG: hypothetical protein WC548_03280 [Candidatus Pacearchaeota archaeon]
MRCKNCGEEAEKGSHCNNCKIADLSLKIDKEIGYNKFLVKLIIAMLIVFGGWILLTTKLF